MTSTIEIIMYVLLGMIGGLALFSFLNKRKNNGVDISPEDVDGQLSELLETMIDILQISIRVLSKKPEDYPTDKAYREELYSIVIPKFKEVLDTNDLIPAYLVPLVTEDNIINLIELGLTMIENKKKDMVVEQVDDDVIDGLFEGKESTVDGKVDITEHISKFNE